jgi:pSer/pThr/pTyr-binding forkhead associated (FHA) protein
MACLVLDFEGLDVLTHELIGDAVTIGRAPSNDIVIDHPTVSAQHARLTKSPSGYRIKDLESTNGTQINGVSISGTQLKDGAEIRFGCITGFFRDAAGSIDQVRKLQLPREHDRPTQISSFQKRRQLFIRSHDKRLSVIAVCINDPDRSPGAFNR